MAHEIRVLVEGDPITEACRWHVAVKLLPNFPADMIPPEKVLVPAKEGDAGRDIHAADDVIIPPSETKLVKTGISIALPEGFEAQVRPTSGNALKIGLTVLNSPGTIDAGYRGEIGVILHNARPSLPTAVFDTLLDVFNGEKDHAQLAEDFDRYRNENTAIIKRGAKIAQIVFARFEPLRIDLVTELPESERGSAGFGSTGTIR